MRTPTPARVTVRGRMQVERLEDRTAPAIIQVGLPTWLEAGPAPVANSTAVKGIGGAPANAAVGAVEAVAPHPTNPDILFAIGVGGGVWRTLNATAPFPDWTPLTDQAPALGMGALAMNAANPDQLLVGFGRVASTYFGDTDLVGAMLIENASRTDVAPSFRVLNYPNLTGHSFRTAAYQPGYMLLGSQISNYGFGKAGTVFRSTDGGASFVALSGQGGLPAPADVATGAPTNESDVYHIVADPSDGNRVFVATRQGLYRTDNILAPVPTWSRIDQPFQGFGPNTANAKVAIHFSPTGGHVLYAGVVGGGGALGSVAWSADLGATWTEMDSPEILDNPIPVGDVSAGSPIQVTTAFNHGYVSGQRVYISGVQGNLETNGIWTITVTGQQTFTLNGSASTGQYQGGGQVQAISGIHVINQGSLHFALAADPADPNLTYIAGDASPTSVSGSVLRGDRRVPRSNGFVAPTPQWTLITDQGAANNGAPHSDTRYLGFDAAGTLLDANDGGVYRQTGPRTNSGEWVSVNGDLGVGGLYTARWDPLNNVVFGGFQDMGNLEQGRTNGAPQGNTVWTDPGALGGDGFLSDVDAASVPGTTTRYWIGGNLSYALLRRQYDNNNFAVSTSFANLADIATPTKFASGYDGADITAGFFMKFALNTVDPRLIMIGGAKVYEDNNPDPALGQTGDVIAKVTPAGIAGRVSSIVYGGRVNGAPVPRIAYVGTDADQLFVRGPAGPFYPSPLPPLPTNALGQQITGTVTDVAVDPDDWQTVYLLRTLTDPGDSKDPFDDRTYSAVYMNTQGGLPDGNGQSTWVEVTSNLVGRTFDANGNLADGLSTLLDSLSVWDPYPGVTDGFEVLLAGGRGGVYRHRVGPATPVAGAGSDPGPVTITTSLPHRLETGQVVSVSGVQGNAGANGTWGITVTGPQTFVLNGAAATGAYAGGGVIQLVGEAWTEYGIGIPNAGVTDVHVLGNHLTAATMGRGAWVVPDVSDSIDRKAQLIVRGDAAANRMTIQADPGNPATVVVNDGLGSSLKVDRNSVQIFHFEGKGGADTIELAANNQVAGDLSFVKFTLTVDAGGDAGDTFVVRDAGRTTPAAATITANTIGGAPGDTLFSGGSTVVYGGLNQGTLVLDLGPGTVNGNQVFVRSTSAFSTRVVGSAGADAIHLGSGAGAGDVGDLSAIGGVVVDGRVPGLDFLVISDYAAAGGNAAVLASGNTVTGFAGPNDGSTVTFANVGTVRLLGSTSPGLPESFRVQNPDAPVFEVYSFEGPDAVNVRSNAQVVNVHAGGGDDVVRVSSFAGDSDDGSLAGILGPLYVDAGPGDNRLVVSDFANPAAATYVISETGIGGGTRNAIQYAATGGRFFAPGGDGLLVRGSNAGNDTFHVVSALAGSQTAADGLGGADVFHVAADATRGDVFLRGSGGNDQFYVYPGFSGGAAASLRLSGGGGADAATVFGLAKDDFATVTMTGPAAGRLTGVGAAVDFDTQERIGFDGAAGRNHLNVVNGTGTRFGTPTDPGSGIVYRPTSETAGEVRFGGGAAGVVEFRGVSGKDANGLVISGVASDVLTVLGFSDDGLASPLGEATAGNGADAIDVTDRLVTLSNASRGYLRSVAVGPAIGTIVVKAGNEVVAGDRITVTPSSQVNILVDGGGPGRAANGDAISINAAGGRTFRIVDDPAVGPRHTRAFLDSGATVGFLNIESNIDPTTGLASGGLRSAYAVSADAGGGPRVAVYDAATKVPLFDGLVYAPTFTGGVRVAMGDVTGDGVPDLVAVAGLGGGPHVQVLDGVTFQSVASFFAYEPSYRGGLYVTAGDVTGDGVAEIITGTGLGGGPLVKVFDGTGRLLNGFFAFEESFRGGVRVGAGDLTGDGIADIVAAPGVGGGPLVRVFDANTAGVLTEFFTDDPTYRSGLYVAAGDLDGDALAEIVIGPGGNSAPDIKVRRSRDGSIVRLGVYDVGVVADPAALPAVPTQVVTATGATGFEDGGVRVAVVGFDAAAGPAQILTGRGAGFPARLHAYSLDPLAEVGSILAFEGFAGGVFVG